LRQCSITGAALLRRFQTEEIAMRITRRWRRYRTLVGALSAYSHHDLPEFGIAHTEIGRVAWNAALRTSAPAGSVRP
jgi:uncharacterized protein YjiS (DUF1127 family)